MGSLKLQVSVKERRTFILAFWDIVIRDAIYDSLHGSRANCMAQRLLIKAIPLV